MDFFLFWRNLYWRIPRASWRKLKSLEKSLVKFQINVLEEPVEETSGGVPGWIPGVTHRRIIGGFAIEISEEIPIRIIDEIPGMCSFNSKRSPRRNGLLIVAWFPVILKQRISVGISDEIITWKKSLERRSNFFWDYINLQKWFHPSVTCLGMSYLKFT